MSSVVMVREKLTIQYSRAVIEKHMRSGDYWMPAFAGMTGED
jgi:hypothetical protein